MPYQPADGNFYYPKEKDIIKIMHKVVNFNSDYFKRLNTSEKWEHIIYLLNDNDLYIVAEF